MEARPVRTFLDKNVNRGVGTITLLSDKSGSPCSYKIQKRNDNVLHLNHHSVTEPNKDFSFVACLTEIEKLGMVEGDGPEFTIMPIEANITAGVIVKK